MGRKPASDRGTLVVPTQRLRVRRPSAPVLLGGVCLLLVGALCAYLRLGLVPSALVEIVTFGAMREARLRRALLEARAARNELRLAIDTIPTIVWSTTADGTVNFVNRAWRDFTGLSAEHAAGGGWLDTLHPDEAALVQATRSAAIAAGRPYELDVRLRQADGTYRWVLRRSVPLRDESGRIVQWYGAGTDRRSTQR